MAKITLNSETITVLKNFASINQSVLIKTTDAVVRNNSKSCIAIYRFKEPLDLNGVLELGIYDTGDFLGIMSAYKNPEIETNDKFVTISEGKSKVKYFTTAADMVPSVPYDCENGKYNIEKKFASVACELEFIIPQEKINILLKMATLLRSEFLFFESVDGAVRITVADELESSNNTWEMTLEENIIQSQLASPVKMNLQEFKILPSDYTVKLSSVGISFWKSNLGVDYYIGLSAM